MNCPKCHGKGWVLRVNILTGDVPALPGIPVRVTTVGVPFQIDTGCPCDHPGCFNGQLSCCEGEDRDEAPYRPEFFSND